jgi:DNA polymerase-1
MDVSSGIDDVMLASYCIDAAGGTSSLEDLAKAHLVRHTGREGPLGRGRSLRDIAEVDRGTLAGYLAAHAASLLPLREKLNGMMAEAGVYERIYSGIEIPLTKVLAAMEAHGVLVDFGFLRDISGELAGFLDTMEGRIYEMAGEEFNINSPAAGGDPL